jgi:Ca2+-transporting ATPase
MTPSRPVPDLPSSSPDARPWHVVSPDATLAKLGTSAAGLSPAGAARRLADFGANEIQETRPVSRLALFLAQFRSVLVWILVIAGVVAGALGEVVDAIAIIAIVLLNAGIGFYQEFKAEQSIAALRRMTAPQARVRRGGKSVVVAATHLVVGDILELEAGDLVAADGRILESLALRGVESALTGESEPVNKSAVTLDDPDLPLGERANMLYKGTSVAAGQGVAVVVATGMQTELGRIAGMIQEAGAGEPTPLQESLALFGRRLVWASLGIVALLFGLGLARDVAFIEMFMTAVSLAVAAVPEGLPAVVTIALALGVLKMARRHTLVRRLPSVETLGSASVICADKTGTLTVGEMTVRELFVAGQSFAVTGEGYGPHGEILIEGRTTGAEHAEPLLEIATALLACNSAELVLEDGTWKVIGDPTEGAMLVAAHKAGGRRDQVERDLPKHHEIPFDSERKRRTVIRRMPAGVLRAFVNGAPEVLMRRCTRIYTEEGPRPLTAADRVDISRRNDEMAGRGLRVLGAAYRDLPHGAKAGEVTADMEHELVFVGLVGMYDPPRPEARTAVERCRDAGIRVVMITGDHPRTALAVARELGIAANDAAVVSEAELNQLSDQELQRRAPEVSVYARVTAGQKLRIVRAWRANDAVVAMTGDGVNDAPALKEADIGIAMGIKGTEVTKQAADMVVADDNFASIVAAVEQGRGIYDNIRKTLLYLLAGNSAELLLMVGCIVAGLPAPLLPIHLLWINLVTDGLPALCLATDPIDPDVMKRHPRHRSERITNRSFLRTMFITGFLTAGVAFAVYLHVLKTGTPETARTYAFAVLVFAELLRAFGARSETKPVWRISLFTNLNLVIVVAISFGLQVWSQHNATLGRFLKTSFMPFTDCLLLLALGAIPLLILEMVKMVRNVRRQRRMEAPPEASEPVPG